MTRIGIAFVGVVCVLILVLATWGVLSASLLVVKAWAVIVSVGLVPAFLCGFWFGKVEVRGFLQGVDARMEKLVHPQYRNAQAPVYTQTLTTPQITFRQLPGGGDIIDISAE